MAFRDIILDEFERGLLGKGQYLQTYKPRPHISASKIEEHNDVSYIGTGEKIACKYLLPIDKRYIGAKELSYDLLLSLYEINSKSAFAIRLYKDSGSATKLVDNYLASLRRLKKAIVEARIIGMQDNEDTSTLGDVLSMLAKRKIEIYEADLFGTSTRHIALDLHTGATFDILIYDRIYKPGELANKLTEEQFSRSYNPASATLQSGATANAKPKA
ncbi:MAG: hypothetical protein ACP5SJ_01525 [Candidatus Micrarchaeia archaeon]